MIACATQEIVALLSTYPILFAVGLIRCGPQLNVFDNPLVLSITGEIEQDVWSNLRVSIRQVFERYDADQATSLPLEIFQARLQMLVAAESSLPVSMGEAISAGSLSWASGSVGGFVRLAVDEASLTDNDPRREWNKPTYALTCHHVLRPTRTDEVKGTNTGESSRSGAANEILALVLPSRTDAFRSLIQV